MNIYEKLSTITTELETVAKGMTVGIGKNQYKAVSERDILDAVKPIEAKYKVYSYPITRELLSQEMFETESEYNGKITKKMNHMARIKTTYRFVNIEKPDEFIDTVTFSDGIDNQDKGFGKAMTYGDKYALMKAYKISTGEDPDQEASKPTYKPQQEKAVSTNTIDKKTQESFVALLLEKYGDHAREEMKNLTGKDNSKDITIKEYKWALEQMEK